MYINIYIYIYRIHIYIYNYIYIYIHYLYNSPWFLWEHMGTQFFWPWQDIFATWNPLVWRWSWLWLTTPSPPPTTAFSWSRRSLWLSAWMSRSSRRGPRSARRGRRGAQGSMPRTLAPSLMFRPSKMQPASWLVGGQGAPGEQQHVT